MTQRSLVGTIVCAFGMFVALAGRAQAAETARTEAASPAGAWAALGAGLTGSGTRHVKDLAVVGNQLIAAGNFTHADGLLVNSIAAWDGTSWSGLGSGLILYPGLNGSVTAIAEHDGQLVVVGQFVSAGGVPAHNVAVWDGTGWSALGAGLDGSLTGVASFDGKIFAARTIAYPPYGVQYALIDHWDSSTGLWVNHASIPGWESDYVTILGFDVVGEKLYIGGEFMGNTWEYDGATFQGLGAASTLVTSFEQFGTDLLAGGFEMLVEKHTPPHDWTPLNPAWTSQCKNVWDMLIYNGSLIVAGSFQSPSCMPNPSVVAWNGSAWSGLGTGMDGAVTALALFDDHLIAAGYFTTADGSPAGLIAQWTGPPVAVRKTTLGGVKALYAGPAR